MKETKTMTSKFVIVAVMAKIGMENPANTIIQKTHQDRTVLMHIMVGYVSVINGKEEV